MHLLRLLVRVNLLLFFTILVAPCVLQAALLGDPAPPIAIEGWIKGAPVRFAPGTNLFIIEFWATWCGPCRKSIPYLTEVQRKYASSNVVVVGISDEPAADVVPFVADMGNTMDYRVAIDPSQRTLAAWQGAYGKDGIPDAYILGTNGHVLWHGFPHPVELGRALERIFSGKYDLDAERNLDTGMRWIKQYTKLVEGQNAAAKSAPLGERILKDYGSDWRVGYYLSKAILTDPEVHSRDIDLALRAATRATDLTRRGSYQSLEMLARAQFALGKKSEAVETQKEALKICNDEEDRPDLEKFLKLFQQQAGL